MRCKFGKAWIGPCGAWADNSGFCEIHRPLRCIKCGDPATQECDHATSLVCGFPLCKKCNHNTVRALKPRVHIDESDRERLEKLSKYGDRHADILLKILNRRRGLDS